MLGLGFRDVFDRPRGQSFDLLLHPMDDSTARSEVLSPLRAGSSRRLDGVRRITRWLYTQNPFYLLSAWLVFFGLHWSFGRETSPQHSAALFSGLLAYTLLLAGASIIVVRIARVWDDARSMLLIVVLLFVATSVALDDTLVQHTQQGRIYYLTAWAVAAVATEIVLRAIRLRLPGLYRVAYHALLALFYWYPVALTPWFGDPSSLWLQWMLFAFTPCASLCFALLGPAVWRGMEYTRENGSPWPWPQYPWSLFAILALCVGGRAYYICLSFHFVGGGSTVFGPYFLLPLVWTFAGLWLAGAARANRPIIAQALLLAPLVWTCVASVHSTDTVYRTFLDLFVRTLHVTPTYLGLVAALAFYLFARALRVAGADLGLTVTLAAMSLVSPSSHTVDHVSNPAAWPWLVAALWHSVFALRDRSSFRALLAGALAAVALDRWLDAAPPSWRFAVAYHVILGAVLFVGLVGRDELSRRLRTTLGPLGLVGALVCLWHAAAFFPARPWMFQVVYGGALTVVALAYSRLIRMRIYVVAGACIACGTIVMGVWPAYTRSRISVPGLDYIVLGMACLVMGLFVSFVKAGYWTSILNWSSIASAREPVAITPEE